MRVKSAVVGMMVALALIACQEREQASLTGTYGSGVLSGQVVMSDGGSPAGVNVGVRGTGISAVLAEDGQFAFAGVPRDAELTFDRASDGVAASFSAGAAAGHIAIELSQNSASRSSKRRGVGSGSSVVVMQFEGIVRSATATQLVLFTKGVEQTIALTAETVIRKGNTTLGIDALTAGTRVHVQAKKVENGFTALHVKVQEGNGEGEEAPRPEKPEAREYEGMVLTATATQLVVIDARGTQTTFVLNAQTVIRKGETPVLATELQEGWRVHVKATTSAEGTRTATQVIVQKQAHDDRTEVKLSGKVTAVSGSMLTLAAEGRSVMVQVNASTKITKRGAAVSLTTIAVGDLVKVKGVRLDAATVLATEIEVK